METNKPMKPQTIGEELYLVHLRRHAGEEPKEEDYDHEHPRKRMHDIGEELWEVHLKRSRGLEPDFDMEGEKTEEATQEQTKERFYNLRSRDSPKKIAQ